MNPISKFQSVMLIDDSEIDMLVNRKMIESSSISQHILIQSGARSAIEFLRNVEELNSTVSEAKKLIPEIIFLDINMPIMDGFQFLDEFEKFSDLVKSSTKIVMLTSSSDPSDLNRAKKYKYVTNYLTKPLSFDNLSVLAE